jgi:single stranded DNA-binding protein
MQNQGKVVLTGEVTDTPIIRATLEALFSATFTLTVTMRRPTRSGAYTDRQKRHCIIAYGDLANTIRTKVRKGELISVEGEFKLTHWEDKQAGETKYLTLVVIDRFSFAEPDQLALPMVA